jgi:GntR family transcriptional regulator
VSTSLSQEAAARTEEIIVTQLDLKYQQVMASISASIERGLPRGSRLPNERTLAQQYNVSRLTVRRALDELEALGLIRRVQGAGTFVEGPSAERGATVRSFTDTMQARGSVPTSRILDLGIRAASNEQGWDLGLSPGEEVVEIERLRVADHIPMCIERSSFPLAKVAGLDSRDLTGSLYAVLERDYGIRISRVTQELRATSLTPEQADLLGCPPYSPALSSHHVAFDVDGSPIESSSSIYRGDRYSIRLDTELPVGQREES